MLKINRCDGLTLKQLEEMARKPNNGLTAEYLYSREKVEPRAFKVHGINLYAKHMVNGGYSSWECVFSVSKGAKILYFGDDSFREVEDANEGYAVQKQTVTKRKARSHGK